MLNCHLFRTEMYELILLIELAGILRITIQDHPRMFGVTEKEVNLAINHAAIMKFTSS